MTTYTGAMLPDDIIYSPAYGRITVAEAAEKAAGNWMDEDSFAWFGQNNYLWAEDWMHYMIETRDSDIMEASNAQAIRKLLAEFIENGSIVEESHSHWAVGYVEKLIIRVYDRVMNTDEQDGEPVPDDFDAREYDHDQPTRRGPISAAFLTLCEIMDQLDNYPLLGEDDYYERKSAAGVWNVKDALWHLVRKFGDTIDEDNLPNGWEYDVHYFLMEDGSKEEDDYPSEDEMFEAFLHFGWIVPEYLDQDQRMEYEVRLLAKRYEEQGVTNASFIDGMTYEDLARSTLAGMTWEQKESD